MNCTRSPQCSRDQSRKTNKPPLSATQAMTSYSQNCSATTSRDSKNINSCRVASDFFISSEWRHLFFVGHLDI